MDIFTGQVRVAQRREIIQAENPYIAAKDAVPKKFCIYECGKECKPSSKLRLCASCPHGYLYSFKYIVGNVYKKIVGLAIRMFNREGRNI